MMQFHFLIRLGVAFTLATILAVRGKKKKSLSSSGAAAAFCVGFLSFLASYRFGVILIMFYQSSSSLTKFKGDVKKKIEADYKEGGQRDYVQVLSCSLLATVVAVLYLVLEGDDAPVNWVDRPRRSFLLCAYLGHYACCNGDTWASELGVLSPTLPRLVTHPWRTVPAGTNGGMSSYGTLASLAAGGFIGLGFSAMGVAAGCSWQGGLVWLGCVGGLGGSLLDSLMGAIFEATFYDPNRKKVVPHATDSTIRICGWDFLTGEQVNALSVAATTALCGWAGKFFV